MASSHHLYSKSWEAFSSLARAADTWLGLQVGDSCVLTREMLQTSSQAKGKGCAALTGCWVERSVQACASFLSVRPGKEPSKPAEIAPLHWATSKNVEVGSGAWCCISFETRGHFSVLLVASPSIISFHS